MTPSLEALFILILVFGVFAFFAWQARQKNSDEQGLVPLVEKSCAGSVRRGNSGIVTAIPFLRLSLYQDYLIVAGIFKYKVMYADIENVSLYNRFGIKGIKIIARSGDKKLRMTLILNSPQNVAEIMWHQGV